jgi:hypothetical protein
MLPNRAPHRVFTVVALLTVLVLASLPAQARQVRHPAAHHRGVAAFGEITLSRIWSFLASLTAKEGMTIDPNGVPKPHGMTPAPGGSSDDEGMTIDPDGRT